MSPMPNILLPGARLAERWLLLIACLLACAVALFAPAAHAQVFGSVGSGCGGLLTAGNCPADIKDGVFSYFVCNMEKLIGELFGQFYCTLNEQFKGPMTAVITLAIVTFGIAFMIGIVQATARDFVLFLLKVVFVWGFATQADLLIGVAYKFFMGGLKEGIAIVVGAAFDPPAGFNITGTGGERIYSYMDEIFNKFVSFTTESSGVDPNAANGDENFCKNAIFAAMALLAIAFPPLFVLGVFLLIKFVLFFLRAVFGYIYAIIGISFLIVIAPIFLSFAFWRQTRQYFDKWIGYLAGFALQMVIVFAFIAFVLSMDVSSVAKDLMNLVVPYPKAVETTGIKWPWKFCTICEFTVTEGTTDTPGGTAKCNEPIKPIDPAALMGGADQQGTRDTLMKLASKVLLTLLVLAYVVNALLDLVPQLAQRIAAAGGIMGMPSLASRRENPLPGEEAIETAGEKFSQQISAGGNPVTAYSQAFSEASKALLVGTSEGGKGLRQNLVDWVANPVM